MVKSRTTTNKQETRGILISHRPVSTFDPNWGELLLEERKNYLQTDARTANGRQVVVGVNNVEEEWDEHLSAYNSNTSCARKNYDLAYIIAKQGSRVNFGSDQAKGFHRAGSSIQAMTGSRTDS